MTSCKDCGYYNLVHYRGTPKDEFYHECVCHWEVLHSLEPCEDFTLPSEMESE